MAKGEKYRLTGNDDFPRHSEFTLKLLRNVIKEGDYESRSSILSLIDRLIYQTKSVIK